MLVLDAAKVIIRRYFVKNGVDILGIDTGVLVDQVGDALDQVRFQVRAAARVHEHFEKHEVGVAISVSTAVFVRAFVQDDVADYWIQLQRFNNNLTGAF
jgi:hypothetical protein